MLLSSRSSVWVWVIAVGLVLAAAVPAGATVRTAVYTWTPATGPVAGYRLYASIDGNAEMIYSHVNQPSAVIEVASGASVVVSVAAFNGAGAFGPRSDASPPLRLCPGDFNGDEVISVTDLNDAQSCVFQAATNDCAGGDLNDDGTVTLADFLALQNGADACAEFRSPADCLGDMDGDGSITMLDILAIRTCVGLYAEGNCISADIDRNGFVSNLDLILSSQAVGSPACSN